MESNRIPKVGLDTIDKRKFNEYGWEFNNDSLIWNLFVCQYYNVGYIDLP